MNEKGYFVLQKLILNQKNDCIEYVVTARDKGVTKDYCNDIIDICKANNIAIYIRGENPIRNDAYYAAAIGWRWIINDRKIKLVVFHDSLLPKYRGFAPLVNMLINGEEEIGVTAILAEEEYDAGNILIQKKKKISYPITIEEAINDIKYLYYEAVSEYIELLNGKEEIVGIPQNEALSTYSCWRDEKDYQIDWKTYNSDKIERFIDAVGFPYKGARTFINGIPICVVKAKSHAGYVVEDAKSNIGKVLFVKDEHAFVVCIEGVIEVIEAYYLDGNSIYPLAKFRSRFGNEIN